MGKEGGCLKQQTEGRVSPALAHSLPKQIVVRHEAFPAALTDRYVGPSQDVGLHRGVADAGRRLTALQPDRYRDLAPKSERILGPPESCLLSFSRPSSGPLLAWRDFPPAAFCLHPWNPEPYRLRS
jgi:hypothetical protein